MTGPGSLMSRYSRRQGSHGDNMDPIPPFATSRLSLSKHQTPLTNYLGRRLPIITVAADFDRCLRPEPAAFHVFDHTPTLSSHGFS